MIPRLLVLIFLCCMILSCRKSKPQNPAPIPDPPADTVSNNPPGEPPVDSTNENPGVPGQPDDSTELPPVAVHALSPRHIEVTENLGGFYEALPPDYDSTTRAYPLMIFLHGGGEVGNGTSDLPLVLKNGTAKLLDQKTFPSSFTVDGESYSFVILTPQFKKWPKSADLNALIDYAKANYRVDERRIYLVGLSMGGGAAWDYGAGYGSRVAAMVPVCGASPDSTNGKKIAGKNVPVWAFHNRGDGVVSVNFTLGFVHTINASNPQIPAKMTIWESSDHDAWTQATDPAYKEEDRNIYEWMLQFSR